jgi:hypothetical protein
LTIFSSSSSSSLYFPPVNRSTSSSGVNPYLIILSASPWENHANHPKTYTMSIIFLEIGYIHNTEKSSRCIKIFHRFFWERVFYCKVFGQIFNLKMRFSIWLYILSKTWPFSYVSSSSSSSLYFPPVNRSTSSSGVNSYLIILSASPWENHANHPKTYTMSIAVGTCT